MQKTSNIGLKPLGDRIVVAPSESNSEKKLPSGIILPGSADKQQVAQGTVVAAGQGKYEDGKLVPMQTKVGDTVLFTKYGYEEMKIDGQEYFILSESAVLAVVSK